jgi:hypothetical protein
LPGETDGRRLFGPCRPAVRSNRRRLTAPPNKTAIPTSQYLGGHFHGVQLQRKEKGDP